MCKPITHLSNAISCSNRFRLLCLSTLLFLFAMPAFSANHFIDTNINVNFDILDCDNTTDGGFITGDETGCASPLFDPSVILNVTHASGGTGTLEYLWMYTTDDINGSFINWTVLPDSNSADYNPTAISETTYYVRCSRREGCTEYIVESNPIAKKVNCDVPCALTVSLDSGVLDVCQNNGTGSITATAANGALPYSYIWSNGQTAATANNLSNGNYEVTVTDANDCTATGSYTLTISNNPIIVEETITGISCGNTIGGSIAVNVSGGSAPYTYTWSNGETSQNITDLEAGEYTLTITDAKGCVSINNNKWQISATAGLDLTTIAEPATCDMINGSINVSTLGGTPPYTYNWSTGSTANPLTDLVGGFYGLTVTDANACTADTIVIVQSSPGFSAYSTTTNTECGATNGTGTVETLGGAAPFTYQWNDPAMQTTATATNLAAGSYVVNITDVNGCVEQTLVSISSTSETEIALTMNPPKCEGSGDAYIQLEIVNGTGPFTFDWDNTIDVQNPLGLTAGMYCVVVMDGNACETSACIDIPQGVAFDIILNPTHTACGVDNGAIDMTILGADENYTYNWDNAPNVENPTNLASGIYCVTVTNEIGCQTGNCVFITDSEGPAVSLTGNSPSCGAANGSISTSVTGGTGTYTYSWDNAADVQHPMNLSAGTYCVTITDEAGCGTTACTNLNNSTQLNINLNKTNASCGHANGNIQLVINGGTGNYTFDWDNAPDVQSPSGLTNGSYCVTVTDEDGCIVSDCVLLNGSDALAIMLNANHPSCGETNGSIEAIVSGGNGAYSFDWENAADVETPTNLGTGTYCVTVTDTDNCIETACVTLNQGPALAASFSAIAANCADVDDGSIQIVIDSGTAPYGYVWDNGDTVQNPSGLAAGTYCVTIQDADNCMFSACTDVTAPPAIELFGNPIMSNPTCGEANGSIQISVQGGTGDLTILWDDNSTNTAIDMLAVGQYCVTVTDENKCTYTECFDLSSAEDLSVDLEVYNPACPAGIGNIYATATGGTAPYMYSWDTGDTTTDLSEIGAGNYCLTITDAMGCEALACAEIVVPSDFEINATSSNPTCFGETNGNVNLIVIGGTAPYTYAWDSGDTTKDLSEIGAGTYCVTVTDANMCTTTYCTDLSTASTLAALANVQGVTCTGAADGFINLVVSGGNIAYSYLWNTGATTEDLTDLAGGTYCVTVTDANACTYAECFELNEPTNLMTTLAGTNPACFGENTGLIDLSIAGGTAPYDILWDNDSTDEDRDGLFGGTYCVTVVDANDCFVEDCVTLETPSNITIIGVGEAPTCTGGNDGSIDLIIGGGQAPYSYSWDNGQTTANPEGLVDGTYCVTVTDANGCTQDACTFILPQAAIELEIYWTDATCAGNDGSLDINVLVGSGTYSFLWDTPNMDTTDKVGGLAPGLYSVTVTDGNGCSAVESAAIGGPGPVDCFDLVNIGDMVWLDTNMDGIQDVGELGVEGIIVNLIEAGTDGIFNTADDVIVDTQTTDENGNYLFEEVPPGTYIIEFVPDSLPSGTSFTGYDEGTDDTLDSDVNFFSGQTNPFDIVDGQPDDLSFDAGIVSPCQNVVTGGEVCCDQVVCGAGANPDPILNITPASGGAGAIEYLWMMNTTGAPFSFTSPEWIPIINSNMESFDPSAVYQTTYYIRCARRDGCNSFSGESNIVTISVQEIPDAEITNLPATVCQNEAISLSAGDGGTLATYTWALGATANPGTADTKHVDAVSWSALGTKTITLTVMNGACVNTATAEIDVLNCFGGGDANRFMAFEVNEMEADKVRLHWTTNPELNDHLFVIEYSINGEDYDHLDVLEGGSRSSAKDYTYEHSNARKGYNYYRIKHLNTNGLTELTDTRFVLCNNTDLMFNVFPNPVLNELNIEFLKATTNDVRIQLINTSGTVVQTKMLDAKAKTQVLDTKELPSGAYYLLIETEGQAPIIQKVFKTRD